MRMFSHATAFGSKYKYGDVVKINSNGEFDHTIVLASGEEIKAKAIIIATGMVEKIPNDVKGIVEFENKGVSYCAICDGALYKGLPAVVIGGGNSAIEEAAYLATVASKVTVIVRNKTRAEQKLIDELLAKGNTEILLGVKPIEIKGNGKVESIVVDNNGKIEEIPCSSIYPYIGQTAMTNFAEDLDITNEQGYIPTDEYMETRVKGIYAIGDVREKPIRQIATAVADGAVAGKILANRVETNNIKNELRDLRK